ncbi:hypothetical protein CEXT_151471 [Caerostris extrusa]|uniref:Uncharacterized protein n=1 Tax=Caerostris extrusa TaxID=172846 RepID=A0AAV4V7T5_CAEEX|nr:hypothetical protein CEXT_151471 [Caerostris extrusa]
MNSIRKLEGACPALGCILHNEAAQWATESADRITQCLLRHRFAVYWTESPRCKPTTSAIRNPLGTGRILVKKAN